MFFRLSGEARDGSSVRAAVSAENIVTQGAGSQPEPLGQPPQGYRHGNNDEDNGGEVNSTNIRQTRTANFHLPSLPIVP